MPNLVFDIETVGQPIEEIDEITREHLLKFQEGDDPMEILNSQIGFSPLTGRIVAIGIYNPDTKKGGVLYEDKEGHSDVNEDEFNFRSFKDEKSLLKEFWDICLHYDRFITFNGRAFDCPFLIIRSMANKVIPSVNLMPNRYYDSHIDLADRLSFFGALRTRGNLHMWCKALGIKSPKEDGISGKDVSKMYNNEMYFEIAKYCSGDLTSTSDLYRYWEKYVNKK